MKKIKKFITLLMAGLMSCTVLGATACGGGQGSGGEAADDKKTQLYVAYLNAGYSDRWLAAAKQRFEEMYANYVFEDGKRGVQVILDPMTSANSTVDMKNKRSHVWFCEDYRTESFVAAGVMADITSALTTSLGASYGKDLEGTELPGYVGETKSIIQKMSAEEKSYYILNDGGKDLCYAVPYIDTYNGTITYDVDLFENEGFYYKADNTIGAKKANGDALGTGPDGVTGTADDGLPRTYEEFFELCSRMQARGVVPFVWAGNWNKYVTELADSLFAQNIGSAQFSSILNGEGTLKDFINGSVSADGSYTVKEETFDSNSFNKIYNTAGLYNAVDFISHIISDELYVKENGFNGAYSQHTAQNDFVFGKEIEHDFAFLVDGTWWYNEANRWLENYNNRVGPVKDRHFAIMALPKADEATFERTKGENVVYTSYPTGICVKKGLSEMQQLLAETFVRFYCTDESLVEYTKIVSNPRGLLYDISDEDYNALMPYAQSLYGVHTASKGYETYKVTHAYSNSEFYRKNVGVFKSFMASSTSKGEYSNTLQCFYDNSSLSSVDYFKGILSLNGYSAK